VEQAGHLVEWIFSSPIRLIFFVIGVSLASLLLMLIPWPRSERSEEDDFDDAELLSDEEARREEAIMNQLWWT